VFLDDNTLAIAGSGTTPTVPVVLRTIKTPG
jgi:hypothetical protein